MSWLLGERPQTADGTVWQGARTGFWDNAKAVAAQTLRLDLGGTSRDLNKHEAYVPIMRALNRDRPWWQRVKPYPRGGLLEGRLPGDKDDYEEDIWRQLDAARRRDPERFAHLPKDRQALDALIAEKNRAAVERAADVGGRSTMLGAVGGFAGGAVASFADPLNVATLAVGGPGKTIIQRVAFQGALAGSLEAVQQPQVAENYRSSGLDFTTGDALRNIGFAAGGGAGGQLILGEVLPAALKRLFGRDVPVTADDIEAARVEIEDYRAVQAVNPHPDTMAGRAFHVEKLDAMEQALAEDLPLPDLERFTPPDAPPLRAQGVDEVVTASGTAVQVRWRLMEAGDLLTSADEGFDARFQPRDRGGRKASDAQIAEIAARLDPEQLVQSRLASQGAPIIGPDGMVESGNGRVAALRRAHALHPDKAAAYRQTLAEHGWDTQGMRAPVLVRERVTPLDDEGRARFVLDANERDTLAFSATERAQADARAIDQGLLDLYQGGALDAAGNRLFIRGFIDRAASADMGALVDSDGALNVDGIRRVRSAMLAKAFPRANLIERIVEDADSNVKAIGTALAEAAPAIARLRSAIAAGDVPAHLDISDKLADVVAMVSRARAEKRRLSDMLAQEDMFGGGADVEMLALARLLFGDDGLKLPRAADKITDDLNFYAGEAMKVSAGPGLFGGDLAPVSSRDLLDATGRRSDGLFGSVAARADDGRAAGADAGTAAPNGAGRQRGFAAADRTVEPNRVNATDLIDQPPLVTAADSGFDGPDGIALKAQVEQLDHDVRTLDPSLMVSVQAVVDDAGAVRPVPQTLANVLADLDGEAAALEALRGCL
jgi:hypothetical protein